MPAGVLKLHGFNNLTKTLSFNIYDVSYASTASQRAEYIEYIDEMYNAERLTQILTEVTHIIGATVLDVLHQDYDPQGASVTMLIADEPLEGDVVLDEGSKMSPSVVAHLDKSHITVHTYPESHPEHGVSTFRADIDVSTCGRVSPLRALNFLIHSFESDIVILDYRVRGFTRDVKGVKHFIDHPISSIQNYIDDETVGGYEMLDVNIDAENIFHTKMRLKGFEVEKHLFAGTVEHSATELAGVEAQLRHEMEEIFHGRNIEGLA